MKKSIFVAVLIAAGFSTAAISAEVKKDTKTPVVKAQKLSDSDMDKVTAGVAPRLGRNTAGSVGAEVNIPNTGYTNAVEVGGIGQNGSIPGRFPGYGRCTANPCE